MNAPRPAVDPAHALLWHESAAALSCLALGTLDARRVHAARKALKQARAALRLLRPGLGPAVYRRENRALRDVGRELAPLRDARVLLDAADQLRTGVRLGQPAVRALRALRPRLRARREQAQAQLARPALRQRAARCLRDSRKRLREAATQRGETAALRHGLGRLYRKARRAFARAARERTPEALHEWRKQTKYLHAASVAMRKAGTPHLRKLIRRAAAIAAQLGDDHDLVALRVEALRADTQDTAATAALVAAIDRRRANLQRRALAGADKLFARKPKRFEERLAR